MSLLPLPLFLLKEASYSSRSNVACLPLMLFVYNPVPSLLSSLSIGTQTKPVTAVLARCLPREIIGSQKASSGKLQGSLMRKSHHHIITSLHRHNNNNNNHRQFRYMRSKAPTKLTRRSASFGMNFFSLFISSKLSFSLLVLFLSFLSFHHSKVSEDSSKVYQSFLHFLHAHSRDSNPAQVILQKFTSICCPILKAVVVAVPTTLLAHCHPIHPISFDPFNGTSSN